MKGTISYGVAGFIIGLFFLNKTPILITLLFPLIGLIMGLFFDWYTNGRFVQDE